MDITDLKRFGREAIPGVSLARTTGVHDIRMQALGGLYIVREYGGNASLSYRVSFWNAIPKDEYQPVIDALRLIPSPFVVDECQNILVESRIGTYDIPELARRSRERVHSL